MSAHILLVDDDDDILQINQVFLQQEGYAVTVARTVEQAYAIIEIENPDLIVLDILLAEGSGIDICKNIRNFTVAPIIFLTSLVDEATMLEALQIGGDDYMTKPYKLTELHARIYANLRRVRMHETKVYEFPPLKINIATQRVLLHEEEVFLTQKEMQLLLVLVGQIGTTIKSDNLFETVWGTPIINESNMRTLHVHISNLRKKLRMKEQSPHSIKTIRNIGYCFQFEEV